MWVCHPHASGNLRKSGDSASNLSSVRQVRNDSVGLSSPRRRGSLKVMAFRIYFGISFHYEEDALRRTPSEKQACLPVRQVQHDRGLSFSQKLISCYTKTNIYSCDFLDVEFSSFKTPLGQTAEQIPQPTHEARAKSCPR